MYVFLNPVISVFNIYADPYPTLLFGNQQLINIIDYEKNVPLWLCFCRPFIVFI